MTQFKRAALIFGIALIMAFGLTVNGGVTHIGPTSAQAVACYAGGCEGLWPWNEGCQYDAYVVYQASAGDFTTFLWYSRACDANWATLQYPPCSGIIHGVDINSGDGATYNSSAPACYGNGWAGTDMVNGSYLAQACGEEGSNIAICTRWG